MKILLVEDHALVRQTLARLLSAEQDMEIVGEAEDGRQALQLALATRPDVILMDLTLPGMNGVEATRRILEVLPEARIIGLSMHDASWAEPALREAGAVAYVSKNQGLAALLQTLRSVYGGTSAD